MQVHADVAGSCTTRGGEGGGREGEGAGAGEDERGNVGNRHAWAHTAQVYTLALAWDSRSRPWFQKVLGQAELIITAALMLWQEHLQQQDACNDELMTGRFCNPLDGPVVLSCVRQLPVHPQGWRGALTHTDCPALPVNMHAATFMVITIRGTSCICSRHAACQLSAAWQAKPR